MHRPSGDFGAFVPGARCAREPTGTGLLDSLTFAVKDLIDVEGCRTGAGNPDWLEAGMPAARSAPVVDALLAAGGRLVGKTITDELAFSLEGCNSHYGTPVNPSCPDRLPGGSSSGSAVAVAGGVVDVALGTDTGGSVRVPAAFVGIFGFRPTHGAVSLEGVVPFAPSYDTVGWFARDADLLARVGKVLLPSLEPQPIRRPLIARDAFALADASVAEALSAVCDEWDVHDETSIFDDDEAEWFACYRVLQNAEIWCSHGPWISSAQPRFGEAIAPRFADAATVTHDEVCRYRPVREKFSAHLRSILPPGTTFLVPTAPCIALPKNAAPEVVSDFYRRALTLTSIAGHAGAPQVTIPVTACGGCPAGLSLVGAPGSDLAILDYVRRQAGERRGAPR
jgi:amidase